MRSPANLQRKKVKAVNHLKFAYLQITFRKSRAIEKCSLSIGMRTSSAQAGHVWSCMRATAKWKCLGWAGQRNVDSHHIHVFKLCYKCYYVICHKSFFCILNKFVLNLWVTTSILKSMKPKNNSCCSAAVLQSLRCSEFLKQTLDMVQNCLTYMNTC